MADMGLRTCKEVQATWPQVKGGRGMPPGPLGPPLCAVF
eukprot:CAMPEP_0202915934 /NCGR_PEP_ID=MMETSP1392-20130828/67129_1 /ASSEMBLY_ACC=CAM_ASM_000868 /TAXON_ID=225041 /ORGANISM="Chlamydomonas chlamydogama, Strain SAG 11-48b" /LENGTH=38 /DNA_ID= /DNA_START= /DNA_END= /DNA_ORIENTATION=